MCYTNNMLAWKEFENKRICVAVSGGADSVALLHFLLAQKGEYGYRLSAVHCEHGIRGEESLEDMRFVQSLCKAWAIPLYLFQENCLERAKADKVSLETAARDFRYECFSLLIERGEADFIAVAHHQDDEVETVLFRMARGTSPTGMVAMKEQNGSFLRPFLGWKKEEILRYIKQNGLQYRTDSTNLEKEATRNKLRLDILPKLEEAVPSAAENILRFARLAAEDDELLYEMSASLLTQEKEGGTVAFCDKKPLFSRACLTALKGLGVEKDYTATHLNALFDLQTLSRGARVDLPKNIRAEKTEKGIYIAPVGKEEFLPLAAEKPFDESGFDGGRYEVNVSLFPDKECGEGWKTLRLDRGKLPKTAVFRFRREGDEIRRFGGGRKSLKKFFNEEKIPPQERGYLPLIAEEKSGVVYAVCGVEISEDVKVDERTKKVLYITIRKKEI